MSSQDVHLASWCTGPISTYTQVTGAPNSGVAVGTLGLNGVPLQSPIPAVGTYLQGGYVHSVNILSAGSAATPPTLLVDGWSNTDTIIAVIPGNQAIGNVQVNAPFQKALRIMPAGGGSISINLSTSTFQS